MQELKQGLLELVSSGKSAEALSRLKGYPGSNGLGTISSQAIGLLARLSQVKQLELEGTQDFDELRQEHNGITKALIALIQSLPDEQESGRAPKKQLGIPEHRFKDHVLYMLLGAKTLIVVFVFTLWESGGLKTEEFISVTGIIVPVFVTYLTLILKEAAQNRHLDAVVDGRIIKRSFQLTAYWLFGAYFVAIVLVINLRGQGVLSEFSHLTGLLSGLETGLGVYVGQIVFTLFKNEK
ncbi:MAG: hypothetical protein ACOYOO_15855, partial [Saprospiraceae bacterium]